MSKTVSRVEELTILERMVGTNTDEYGAHLQKILESRKEVARRLIRGHPDDEEFNELKELLKYHNNLICEVLAMPRY